MILHGAKYPTCAVAGVLIGQKDQILEAIPLVHSLLLPTPMIQIALNQVEIYATKKGLKMVGVYFGNEANVDVLIHSGVELIANQIQQKVGGEAVIVRVFVMDGSWILLPWIRNVMD